MYDNINNIKSYVAENYKEMHCAKIAKFFSVNIELILYIIKNIKIAEMFNKFMETGDDIYFYKANILNNDDNYNLIEENKEMVRPSNANYKIVMEKIKCPKCNELSFVKNSSSHHECAKYTCYECGHEIFSKKRQLEIDRLNEAKRLKKEKRKRKEEYKELVKQNRKLKKEELEKYRDIEIESKNRKSEEEIKAYKKEYNKRYREKNKEYFREYQKEYRNKKKPCDRDRSKKYYEKNKEKLLEYQKKYREKMKKQQKT